MKGRSRTEAALLAAAVAIIALVVWVPPVPRRADPGRAVHALREEIRYAALWNHTAVWAGTAETLAHTAEPITVTASFARDGDRSTRIDLSIAWGSDLRGGQAVLGADGRWSIPFANATDPIVVAPAADLASASELDLTLLLGGRGRFFPKGLANLSLPALGNVRAAAFEARSDGLDARRWYDPGTGLLLALRDRTFRSSVALSLSGTSVGLAEAGSGSPPAGYDPLRAWLGEGDAVPAGLARRWRMESEVYPIYRAAAPPSIEPTLLLPFAAVPLSGDPLDGLARAVAGRFTGEDALIAALLVAHHRSVLQPLTAPQARVRTLNDLLRDGAGDGSDRARLLNGILACMGVEGEALSIYTEAGEHGVVKANGPAGTILLDPVYAPVFVDRGGLANITACADQGWPWPDVYDPDGDWSGDPLSEEIYDRLESGFPIPGGGVGFDQAGTVGGASVKGEGPDLRILPISALWTALGSFGVLSLAAIINEDRRGRWIGIGFMMLTLTATVVAVLAFARGDWSDVACAALIASIAGAASGIVLGFSAWIVATMKGR